LRNLDNQTRFEIERMQKFGNRGNERDLSPAAPDYPLGDMYGNDMTSPGSSFDSFYG
jgi:hypothetical protein